MADKELLELILHEVTCVRTDVTDLKTDVALLKTEMREIKADISELKSDVALLKTDVAELKENVAVLNSGFTILNTKVTTLQSDMSDMKLTFENEIRVNIRRVAEGHLDLSRNLHEAMKPSNEVEMLSIRVHILESEMKEVKQKIS